MEKLIKIQKNEITEYYVYKKLLQYAKNSHHKAILEKIADEELNHYKVLKGITGLDIKPKRFKVFIYVTGAKMLGLNFMLKLMESGEADAYDYYKTLNYTQLTLLAESEKEHENNLISMIDEDILKYAGSVVLGLNDALVELTGALVGFTFAISDIKMIAAVGFIMGFAASMSMGVSNYLSVKNEKSEKHPIKSAFYTFFSYLITVSILIIPYLIFLNKFYALVCVIFSVISIIAIFNFYVSISMGYSFKKRFLEMFLLSMAVAFFNWLIGIFIKHKFGM